LTRKGLVTLPDKELDAVRKRTLGLTPLTADTLS
jgi:hypothetical protein